MNRLSGDQKKGRPIVARDERDEPAVRRDRPAGHERGPFRRRDLESNWRRSIGRSFPEVRKAERRGKQSEQRRDDPSRERAPRSRSATTRRRWNADGCTHRSIDLQPRIADITEPLFRILLETSVKEIEHDRRRACWYKTP